MAYNKVWVIAEAFDGKPLTVVSELLTKGRSLGGSLEAVCWCADVESYAGELGKFGVTKVHNAGDLASALPGPALAGAIAARVQAGDGPDAILVPQNYDGRDIAGRLSAKLGVGVLTNLVGLSDDGESEHAIFGGT